MYLQNTTPTSSNTTVSTAEDNDKTFASSDFPYTDADGDVLTNIQITTLESAGTLYLDANSNGTNDSEDITLNQIISAANISKLKLKPAANANGSPYATFGFKVGDASVYSASAYTMTINVTAVNDAPSSANNTVTTNEDVTKIFASGDFSFTDIDAGDALTKIQITTLESAGTLYLDANSNGSNDAEDVTLNQEITTANISTLKFLPSANANGNGYATFQFKVSDGTAYSASSYTMTINVTAVNDAPTAANNTVSATEDNDKTFASTDFTYSDTEGSAMSLVQIATAPSAGTLYNDANLNGTVDGGETLSASSTITKTEIDAGKLKFKPAANGNGTPYTTFTFKVNDGTDYSASSYTMTINVSATNDPPAAANNSVTFNEDNDKTFAASEFNYTDSEGSTMSLVQVVTIPSVGTLYNDANTNGVVDGGETLANTNTVSKANIDANQLKFKPASDSSGTPYTSFTFKVNDGTDYSASSYTMTINVTAVNDAPTAANNAVTIAEDNEKTFASSEFNYSDKEGSAMSQIQIDTIPSAGTLYNDANTNGSYDGGEELANSAVVSKSDIDLNKLKFRPAANGNGNPYTTFSFKVNDGTDYSASSYTMTINVTPVVDVTFTDGSSYSPPSALPSTNNNPVGRFLLTGDIAGASLSALTVSFVSSPSGVTAVKLWSSSDNAYDSGTDTQLSSTTVSGNTASFSSFSSSVSSSGTYYFVTVDLNSSASGAVEPFIANNSHVTILSGGLAGTITNASLSNGGAPLPVELTAFSASSKRLNVELQWKTVTEVNNYGFEIERTPSLTLPLASGGQSRGQWTRVGFIEGAGTSNAPKEYTFTDKNSAAGKYLYRLKQIDRDGKFGYSKEIEIEAGSTANVFALSQNFPNPFNPATTIEFSVPEDGMTTLKVFDILGREVQTLITGELKAGIIQHVEFDASHLSSGVYFARLQFKEHVQMKRMILVK